MLRKRKQQHAQNKEIPLVGGNANNSYKQQHAQRPLANTLAIRETLL